MTSVQIRQQFIDFFCKTHGHTFVPSSPVVPLDDPTLLFTNAGMNQFKPIFLGSEKRPYVRAANTQKCIRAGGKHNDLDDVGRSRRHHTFFEMLGNWSFGDYFKRGAIEMAWELLTVVWKLDPSRLHVTCFEGDEKNGVPRDTEAAGLWKEVAGLSDDHIHYFGKDNFWEMGETGPCGPCTEIHIDRTPDRSGGKSVNGEDPRVMEIWNLVFIQYNRNPDRSLTVLPAQHVDTGMGFERICQVIQGKNDNYATDLWEPLFAAIAKLSGMKYTGQFPAADTGGADMAKESPQLQVDIAFRAIADHVRMSTFAITDGGVPSNRKRGAVLRSVIRRAVRYGYQVLKLREPFLHTLVPVVIAQMGDAFPELKHNPNHTAQVIRNEEVEFLAKIASGLELFDAAATRARTRGGIFLGEDIHGLHSTFGFPSDMTIQLAASLGLKADVEGYEAQVKKHAEISGQGRTTHAQLAVDLTGFTPTDDSPKYDTLSTEAKVLGWVNDSGAVRSGRLIEDDRAGLLLDRTPFYAEQGGQAGDGGIIQTPTGRLVVESTERRGEYVLHWGTLAAGSIEPGQDATAKVDARRRDTMRNHTATHVLNWALRKVLGDHVEQKGSLVDPDKLRFDFSHERALSAQEISQVERLANQKIYADEPVTATIMPLAEAKKLSGVRAVFGEKYPDPVRVVAIGTTDPRRNATLDHSIEFCGGTHLSRTGEAGFVKITSEENVAKGVRRIVAVTGRGAVEHVQRLDESLKAIALALSTSADQAPQRLLALQEEVKTLKKKLASGGAARVDPVGAAARLMAEAPEIGGGKLVVGELEGATPELLRAAVDSIKAKSPSHAVMLAAKDAEAVNFVSAVSDDLIAKGLKAGDWIRETAKVAGGGGGGRPQMAQAGGKDPSKTAEALEAARAYANKTVK